MNPVRFTTDLFNPRVARFINKFEVAPEARAIAFHWTTGNVIIASQTPNGRSQVLLHSKEGKLERNIDIEWEKEDFIGSATVTMDGSTVLIPVRRCLYSRNKLSIPICMTFWLPS